MPHHILVMFAAYFLLIFSVSCSSQSFKPGKSDSKSSILSKDAVVEQESSENQLEQEDDEGEEDIVAVPPAVISGSYLVCETISSDSTNRTAEISCHFITDGDKVDISSVDEFEIEVKDVHENSLDFNYSIKDEYHIILNVQLQDSNTFSVAILDAKTGTSQLSKPMDAFGLAETSEQATEPQKETNEALPEEMEEVQEEAENTPMAEEGAAEEQQAEPQYVVIIRPGEYIDTSSPRPCSLNELYCLFIQNDRNIVVRKNPSEERHGATGTTRSGGYAYFLNIKANQEFCIQTVDRDKRSRDFCFGTADQFDQDPMLILTNAGELKLVGEDKAAGIDIVIPGQFNPF